MRGAQKPSRLHHYFPRFHLGEFATGDGRLWVYDKATRISPNPKLLAPANIAAEAHLYVDDAPADPVEGLEEWLAAAVDGPAAEAVRKVIRHENITAGERESVGRYVMSRDLRTPATRDFIMETAQRGIEADYDARVAGTDAIRKAILADGGPELSDDEICEFGRMYRPVVPKGFWLEYVKRHTIQALPRLLAKGWTLVHADDGLEFVSSDVGIVKHWGHFGNPAKPAPGWWLNADCWVVPLNPRVALAMAPGLPNQEKKAMREWLDPFNATLIRQAKEFVFAHDEQTLRNAIAAAA